MIAEAMAQAIRMTATERQATGGGGGSDGGREGQGGGEKTSTIHKYYTRLEKFDGEGWKEWYYQFGVATSTYSYKNAALLEVVEGLEMDEVTTEDVELKLATGESEWMRKTQAEMFGVLSLLTTGEANVMVRGCIDKNGYTAWKKLYDRFNPKTPASLTAAWREVIRPKKVKDMREAGKAIDAWESKVTMLKKEHGEEPTTGLKASLLLEMLPDHAQLTVAQGMSSKKLDYDTLKAKIKLMANVQIDYATPKPMDIGETETNEGEDWVDVVGMQKGKGKGPQLGSCWTCGGSHFARDCPKGYGKGKKGGGKGEEKGKGKGKSTGPMFGSCWTCGGNHFSRECPKNSESKGAKGGGKGKGKNIQCYSCGGWGHRADRCPTALGEVEQDYEEEEGEVENVSGDWGIFGLEECKRQRPVGGGQTSKAGRPGRWARKERVPVKVHNRFGALTEEDEEEVWIQEFSDAAGWKSLGKGEIVVDSGAAESVCPWDWAKEFGTKDIPWDQKRMFLNASGGRMEHYGERKVFCKAKGLNSPISMKFQVSDSRNPLASVARIVENGNIVQFGPKDEDNYIYNPKTEEKVAMRRKGRKYVLDVDLIKKAPSFIGQA